MFRRMIAALLLLVWVSAVRGARDIEFNVDFFCGWEGYYRPMEWTPVEVGISAPVKEPFSGVFTMTARQDGLNTLNIMHNFVLTPDRPLSTPLVTKFAFATDRCTLAIRDEKGRTSWRQAINMWDFSQGNRMLRVVQDQDMLIGLIGQSQFGLLRLPESTASLCNQDTGKVYLGSKVPRVAPWDWTGYASLDLLILCDVDWTLLRPEQCQAIGQWISNGGTALVILGQHPLPANNSLAQMLPFRVEGPAQAQIPSQALLTWGLDSSRTHTVTAWTLLPKPQAVIDTTVEATDTAGFYGAGYAGFGRVAVLGFNPSQLSETQASRSAAFWTRLIDASCGILSPANSDLQHTGVRRIVLAEQAPQAGGNTRSGPNRNDNYYKISVSQSASNQVMEYLYKLEQMKPLSIWWIVLTLMTLALLLGPVDYFVLKRLDKLPYTWLTSTGWIIIFTVGAYFGVQWLRGGATEVRAVTVLDSIADSNCAWATSYTGLFASRSGDYRLEGLRSNQWWSGISPAQQEMWSHQRDTGMQQIHCVQADGGNLPVSLPVNMWTVQPLLSEWALDRMPFIASVEHRGADAVIEIRNTSDSAIQRGYVLFQDTCADLGSVPAHTTQRFEARTRPFRSWQPTGTRPTSAVRRQPSGMRVAGDTPSYPGSLGEATNDVVLAQGCLSRTLAMHTYLDFGAALVCVVFENAPLPVAVKDRTYTVSHIQMARQLVLPKRVIGSQ